MLVIRAPLPNERLRPEDDAEIAAPGYEGEVRLHERVGIELVGHGFQRFPAGWYVEVYRTGGWCRAAGPFWGGLTGVPKEAAEAALAMEENERSAGSR